MTPPLESKFVVRWHIGTPPAQQCSRPGLQVGVHDRHACNMHLQHSCNIASPAGHALHKIGHVLQHAVFDHPAAQDTASLKSLRGACHKDCSARISRHTHTNCLPTTVCCWLLLSVLRLCLLLLLACLCPKPVLPLLCCLNPCLNHPLRHHRPVVRHLQQHKRATIHPSETTPLTATCRPPREQTKALDVCACAGWPTVLS